MKPLRALFALLSIPLLFLGMPPYPNNYTTGNLIAHIAFIGLGLLLLAVAFDAFRKPAFFLVPISAIIYITFFGIMDKFVSIILFFLFIAISSTIATEYYKLKEPYKTKGEGTDEENRNNGAAA